MHRTKELKEQWTGGLWLLADPVAAWQEVRLLAYIWVDQEGDKK